MRSKAQGRVSARTKCVESHTCFPWRRRRERKRKGPMRLMPPSPPPPPPGGGGGGGGSGGQGRVQGRQHSDVSTARLPVSARTLRGCLIGEGQLNKELIPPALGPPFSARSIRPRYSLAALCLSVCLPVMARPGPLWSTDIAQNNLASASVCTWGSVPHYFSMTGALYKF
jgi:hypothetical protein